jgi:hypothetical protein
MELHCHGLVVYIGSKKISNNGKKSGHLFFNKKRLGDIAT